MLYYHYRVLYVRLLSASVCSNQCVLLRPCPSPCPARPISHLSVHLSPYAAPFAWSLPLSLSDRLIDLWIYLSYQSLSRSYLLQIERKRGSETRHSWADAWTHCVGSIMSWHGGRVLSQCATLCRHVSISCVAHLTSGTCLLEDKLAKVMTVTQTRWHMLQWAERCLIIRAYLCVMLSIAVRGLPFVLLLFILVVFIRFWLLKWCVCMNANCKCGDVSGRLG